MIYRVDGTGLISSPYGVFKRFLGIFWKVVVYCDTYEEAVESMEKLKSQN